MFSPSTNLPCFLELWNGSTEKRGIFVSSIGTGLGETYSFIYSNGQLKAELTVRRTICQVPELDVLFGIRQYAGDAFRQPIIAETDFLLDQVCFLYD